MVSEQGEHGLAPQAGTPLHRRPEEGSALGPYRYTPLGRDLRLETEVLRRVHEDVQAGPGQHQGPEGFGTAGSRSRCSSRAGEWTGMGPEGL